MIILDNNIKFKSLTDLYNRLLPALKSKVNELKRNKIMYINEIDLWNYLKDEKWMLSTDLDLGEMVNDIFNAKVDKIDKYIRKEKDVILHEE